jgi:hypothetical protein
LIDEDAKLIDEDARGRVLVLLEKWKFIDEDASLVH